jgi:hypothetical protein
MESEQGRFLLPWILSCHNYNTGKEDYVVTGMTGKRYKSKNERYISFIIWILGGFT